MKRILAIAALVLLVVSVAPAHYGRVSFGAFYSSLEPYGEWIVLGDGYYGWRPMHVATEWRPYFYGRWAWTDQGWYWVSDEPWAWAAYHYGRWYYDDYYGWIWIPGYDWAPAWVEWRYSGDVVGWAPLGPYAVFSVGFGISYHRHWVTPHFYWSYVHPRYICAPRIYRHVYHQNHNRHYYDGTRSLDGIVYRNDRIVNRGPERDFIERRSGQRIRETSVVDVRDRSEQRVVRTSGREEIRVYRPEGTDRQTTGREIERPQRIRETDRRPSIELQDTEVYQRGRSEGETRGVQRTQPSVRERQVPTDRQATPQRVTPRQGQRSEPAVKDRQVPSQRQAEPQRVPPRQVQPAPRTPERPRSELNRTPAPQSFSRPEATRPSQSLRERSAARSQQAQPRTSYSAPQRRSEQSVRAPQSSSQSRGRESRGNSNKDRRGR